MLKVGRRDRLGSVASLIVNRRSSKPSRARASGPFASTTGLIFLGTPFRGAEGMSQVEMLAAAQREYSQDEIQPEVLKILEPALNNMGAFASLRESQGRVEDARYWYSQALVGYEKTFGPDHNKCEPLRTKLALLPRGGEEQSSFTNTGSVEDSLEENEARSVASLIKPASYRHRLVAGFRRKQK